MFFVSESLASERFAVSLLCFFVNIKSNKVRSDIRLAVNEMRDSHLLWTKTGVTCNSLNVSEQNLHLRKTKAEWYRYSTYKCIVCAMQGCCNHLLYYRIWYTYKKKICKFSSTWAWIESESVPYGVLFLVSPRKPNISNVLLQCKFDKITTL